MKPNVQNNTVKAKIIATTLVEIESVSKCILDFFCQLRQGLDYKIVLSF